MSKNSIILIIICVAFLPISYHFGEKLRDTVYKKKSSSPTVVLSSSREVGDLDLTDHNGKPFRFANFGRDYVLVFFGYTFCPDFCPSGLMDIKTALEELGEEAKRVGVAFVSFDPKRDTQEMLAEYMGKFHKDFTGLTGTDEEIKNVANRFGVQYKVTEETKEDKKNYQFAHSLSYFLVGAGGKMVKIFRYSEGPEKLAAGLKEILAGEI